MLVLMPAAILVVLIGLYVLQARQVAGLREQVRLADEEIVRLQPQVGEVDRLRQQIEAARVKEDLLARLLATQLPASSILANVRALLPKDAWLTSLTIPDTTSIVFEGFGTSFTTVARLMDSLESSPLFEQMDLTVVERDVIGRTELVKFQVTGKLSQGPVSSEGSP